MDDKRNQINGRKCLVFVFCETAIIAIGYGVTLMFPKTSPYLWFGIGGISLLAAWVVWNWPLAMFSPQQKEKMYHFGRRVSEVQISLVGWVIASLLVVFITYKPIMNWIQEQKNPCKPTMILLGPDRFAVPLV